jgi:acetylornithine deacetylase/succinyl-diaminopimelate desuccinylase-like protein
MSDLVHFRGIPSLKVGPGRTERSHTADEFVQESEVLAGARFYEALARAFFRA